MVEFWFGVTAVMLAAYAVLDGFDFGAGALHLWVAKQDQERRQVLAAIGPYWDGNEVWLLASGGVLFAAFPRVLASALSGFYFAIFLVLWSLILRGIAIEFRSHLDQPLWRSAWDTVFGVASTALPILFGAALGNVVRGLPVDRDGWFSLALFTDFTARSPVGILDWYTVSAGVFTLVAILNHGALFLAWKTDGAVHERARAAARWLFPAVCMLWPIITAATCVVNGALFDALTQRPLSMLCTLVAVGGLVTTGMGKARGRHLQAFLGSCAFVIGVLAATAASMFPVMLRSMLDESWSLTAFNSTVAVEGLYVAARWLAIGFPLAGVYLATLFWLHRGKARAAVDREGY